MNISNQTLNQNNQLKCVIFDMDGLLVDTEYFRYIAYKKALKKMGVILTLKAYIEYWVSKGTGLSAFLISLQVMVDTKTVRNLKTKFFLEKLNHYKIKSFDGVYHLFEALKKENIKIALATSSVRKEATFILNKTKLINYFDFIATREDVLNPKPSPEIYFYILQQLDISIKNTISIDDAQKGIVGSKKANIKTIAVPNSFTKDSNLNDADIVIDSIDKIDLRLLNTIIQKEH